MDFQIKRGQVLTITVSEGESEAVQIALSNLEADLQKVFGAESALLAKLSERADNIKENAETNISLLNSELYGGTYSYDKYGSDIYDVLFGNQYNAKG